jgi:hypothetical protein
MFNHNHTDQTEDRGHKPRRLSYANLMSTVSVFLVVAGGTAFAATTLSANSVNSKTVKDNALKSVDLKDGKAVSTEDVIDDSLTGTDINESTLGQVPDSAQLQGRAAASFLSSSVYKNESAVAAGTALGDGTHVISESCNPGDVLLSGGPANIAATSTLLESFPSPGTTNGWTARINKNAQTDNFSVVVLCVDQ